MEAALWKKRDSWKNPLMNILWGGGGQKALFLFDSNERICSKFSSKVLGLWFVTEWIHVHIKMYLMNE